jgi:hypothetical protein
MKLEKVISHLILSLMMFILVSCLGTAPKEGEQTVVKGGAVASTVEINVVGGRDLGLFLIGDDSKVITVSINNKSSLPIDRINLAIDAQVSAGMTFNPNLVGERNYPGFQGTCGAILAAGESCLVKIMYSPLIQGVFSQKLSVSYNDVVKSHQVDETLTLQTGASASLIFTNEISSYSFGVNERKDCTNILYQAIQVKNAGGLPAANIIWSLDNTPNIAALAYKVSSNSCPATLNVGQTCDLVISFQPQNWGDPQDCDGSPGNDVAPDLDAYEIFYNGQLRADYSKDPLGGTGSLNGYFSSLSTTIEGRIEVSGLDSITFDDDSFVAGGSQKRILKLSNFGYKEAIARSIHVRQGGVHVATCVKDSVGTSMQCRNPGTPGDTSSVLTKKAFPFKLVDFNECFDTFDKMTYTRDVDGNLSIPNITTVGGIPIGGVSGSSCFLEVYFEPSVTHSSDGNFTSPNELEFVVEYDSTWKNTLDAILTLRGDVPLVDALTFKIVDSMYKAPARLFINDFTFNNLSIMNTNKVLQLKTSMVNETALDDGSILDAFYIELKGDTFTWEVSGGDEILSEGAKFSVTNLPPGLTVVVKKVAKDFGEGSFDHAEVSFTGTATAHNSAQNSSNFEISFTDAAFTSSSAGDVFNSTIDGLSFNFFDSYLDFNPDSGDSELNVFVHLGRIAMVNNTAYNTPISLEVKNSGSEDATITKVVDGKSNTFSLGAFVDINETDGTYYKSVGFDTNIISSGFATGRVIMSVNPLFLNDSAKEKGLLFDVNTGINANEQYKKMTIEYDDGALFNDDGTARRKQKINIFWTGVLVKKGFLVIDDVGNNQGVVNYHLFHNVDHYDLVLKNDGTGPVNGIKLSGNYDDFFDYSANAPVSFVDDPSCNAPGCKDCFEIMKTAATPWPGAGALDCAGADTNSCLNPGESCTMKVEVKAPSTASYNPTTYDEDRTRDYSLADEAGANPERNWTPNSGFIVDDHEVSIEYLDGDHNGRADEDVPDYGDIQIISGQGALSSGTYVYRVRYRVAASFIPTTPMPIESALIYRQAITLPSVTSDVTGLSDRNLTTVPAKYFEFTQNPTDVVRGHESETLLGSVLIPSDDTTYDYVYHGGTFPFDGSTYKLSLTFLKLSNTAAKNVSITFDNKPASLTHTTSAFTPASVTGSIVVAVDYTPTGTGESVSGDLTISYENQLIDSGGAPVVVTKKIKIMAASSAGTSTSISSQELDVSDVPFGAVTNYTLKYNDVAAESELLKDIKGGSYVARRFTVTNNSGSESMKNIAMYIKSSVLSASLDASGIGHSIADGVSPCYGTTLGPGNSCTFDIRYEAPSADSGGPYERFLFLSYAIEDNQYITNQVTVNFEPADPAILEARRSSNLQLLPKQAVNGFYPEPYRVSYGTNMLGNHIVANSCSPMESRDYDVTLRNTEVEKASLLRAYRCLRCEESGGYCKPDQEKCYTNTPAVDTILDDTAVFSTWHPAPGAAPVEIFKKSNGLMTVTADRECLYGPTGVSPGKGYTSLDGDICEIHVNWTFDETQLGKQTIHPDNTMKLEYYSSELSRRPQDATNILFKGFIEPNETFFADTTYSNVEATSDGNVQFSFQAATEDNINCGGIDVYRIFYSDTASLLNKVWTTSADYIDVAYSGGIENISLSGLNAGSYYYFKIAALRTFNGVQNISESNMPVLTVVVPPLGSYYDHNLSIIFDDYTLPEGGGAADAYYSPDDARDACDDEDYSLSKNGGTTNVSKVLVSEAIWDHINTDADFTSYGGGDPWIFPHWLDEPLTDITPIFNPGYDCAVEQSNTADNEYAYAKSCTDCSCNNLPLLVGKNLLILPFKYNYLEPNGSFFGYARCYAPVTP